MSASSVLKSTVIAVIFSRLTARRNNGHNRLHKYDNLRMLHRQFGVEHRLRGQACVTTE